MTQEKTKSFKRATAIKVHIDHLFTGNYVKDEVNNYLQTEFGIRISRVRLLGTIVRKWKSPTTKDEKSNRTQQTTIIIDDGTETIRVTAWKEDTILLEEVDIGDIVDVIGKIRKYENQIYIIPEIVRKIEDPNWELVRELEIIEFIERIRSGTNSQIANKLHPQISESNNNDQNTKRKFKDKIVELIRELDEGSGVSVNQLKEQANIPEIDFQDTIMELINEGRIYQPRSGKYKIL